MASLLRRTLRHSRFRGVCRALSLILTSSRYVFVALFIVVTFLIDRTTTTSVILGLADAPTTTFSGNLDHFFVRTIGKIAYAYRRG